MHAQRKLSSTDDRGQFITVSILTQMNAVYKELELDSENEVPPTVAQPPGTLFLPTATTLLTPVHSENDFMIVHAYH